MTKLRSIDQSTILIAIDILKDRYDVLLELPDMNSSNLGRFTPYEILNAYFNQPFCK